MDNFDNPPFELTPELEAKIKRSIQECNDGRTYLMLTDEDGHLTWNMQCNKCKRVGNPFKDRPFPHKFDCPMRYTVTD